MERHIYAQSTCFSCTAIYSSIEVASNRGKFLVGCDGGHSKVRRAWLGNHGEPANQLDQYFNTKKSNQFAVFLEAMF